jgi:hypothetical protein
MYREIATAPNATVVKKVSAVHLMWRHIFFIAYVFIPLKLIPPTK